MDKVSSTTLLDMFEANASAILYVTIITLILAKTLRNYRTTIAPYLLSAEVIASAAVVVALVDFITCFVCRKDDDNTTYPRSPGVPELAGIMIEMFIVDYVVHSTESTKGQEENYFFEKIRSDSPHFHVVIESLRRIVEPIYGAQVDAARKIGEAHDRQCELLFVKSNSEPATAVGLIVYKLRSTGEYGLFNYMELKSFFVINAQKHSGKGYGTRLLQKVEREARARNFSGIYGTINDSVTDTMRFFTRNGFSVADVELETNVTCGTEKLVVKKL